MSVSHLKTHAVAAQASRGSFGTYGATTSKNPAQLPKNGGRVGAKTGHKIVGKKVGGVLNTTFVLPNGGRKGAK